MEGLGWNHYQAEPLSVPIDGRDYLLRPVAEKANVVVYACDSSQDNNVPSVTRSGARSSGKSPKRAFEHLIVFADPGGKTQVWQWVGRESGKPAVCREWTYVGGQSGDPLLQRLRQIAFWSRRGAGPNRFHGHVTPPGSPGRGEGHQAVSTKRFRAELTAFGKFIDGITAQGDRDWYASLMLNRMMFVYFVQKQGFLDGDLDYLRDRLRMVQTRSGGGRFQQFLSHLPPTPVSTRGLGQPEDQRAPDLAALLGKVPFLNGGLFDVHDLERDYPDISIPDEAFERVFDFFDGYRWHLDERPRREDNEINPDVLGYIFEKYVNQKQMGAYYTKEDITGYIGRNTVIPFLFDAAKKECPVAFGPDGGVWRLLRDDPDRYNLPGRRPRHNLETRGRLRTQPA